MIARLFFLIGLAFLLISLAFLAIFLSLPQHSSATVLVSSLQRGAGGGPGLLADIPIGNLLIDKYWPNQMNINTSDNIKVILATATTGPFFATTATTGTHRVAEETPLPYGDVGTPGAGGHPATIRQAFGPNAEPFAVAHLVTTTFDVKPSGPEEKPLAFAGGQVEWDWNFSPKTLGSQLINVDMELLWRNKSNGQVIQELPILQSQFNITVTQPFLDTGQLTIGAIASAALGSGGILTSIIAWLLDQIGKRWEGRKKQTNKSPDLPAGQPPLAETPPHSPPPPTPTEVSSSAPSPHTGTATNTATNVTQEEQSARPSTSPVSPTPPVQQATRPHPGPSVNITIFLVALSLLAVLVVLIVGAGGLINYTAALRAAQLRAQHTQATATARSLATANAQATSFALSTTPQGVYIKATSSIPVLNDPLSSQKGSAWHNYSGAFGSCLFTSGAYHISIPGNGTSFYCRSTLRILNNFAFQVQMAIIRSGYGAIIFQADIPPYSVNSKIYTFFVRQDGVYYLIEGRNLVRSSGSLPMMHTGLNQSNVIAMVTHGGTLYLYVNKMVVTSVSHVNYQYGEIMLGGYSENEPVDVGFSNAQVWIF